MLFISRKKEFAEKKEKDEGEDKMDLLSDAFGDQLDWDQRLKT
jgi:hypothetical protein